jgi:LmbE family N-acetylglucosaminyl deacetylase
MLNLTLENVKTVLLFGAHADDIEIGCGGTILKLLAEHPGLAVHWVVLGAGGRRADEAVHSARLFLGDDPRHRVVVKGFRDSYFPYIGGQIKEYVEELRQEVAPEVIFTHRRDDLHQDHRLLSELAWCAFRDHLILEYEIPKYDGDMGRPNLYVPLDEAVCRRKIAAIMEAFPSQHDKPWFTEDAYWALLRLRGVECHAPGRFAEAFYAKKMVL